MGLYSRGPIIEGLLRLRFKDLSIFGRAFFLGGGGEGAFIGILRIQLKNNHEHHEYISGRTAL